MDPLTQTKMLSLMNISSGHPDITIGIIDGPVDLNHPAFQRSRIRTVRESQYIACKNASDTACVHGTSVTSILSANRGLFAPAICPDCSIILNPVFTGDPTTSMTNNNSNIPIPSTTAEELSNAIMETIDAGSKIINLSLGLSTSSLTVYDKLQQAYDYALQKGVIIVVAAGNQGRIGNISLINHQWLIPVAACDEDSKLDPMSNFGPSIGRRGLMAPGVNISSAYPGGQHSHMSGTSFAAPFVTGAIALLWSIFPNASPSKIIYSMLKGASHKSHRSIIPPLLNGEAAMNILNSS